MEGSYSSPGFQCRLTKGERIALICYLPLHQLVVPTFSFWLIGRLGLSEDWLNVIYYSVGAVFMLLFLGRFLRREFDPMCDNLLPALWEIFLLIILKQVIDVVISLAFSGFSLANPNNSEIESLVGTSYYKIVVISVYLAPIVEECLFRGLLFGSLVKYNRLGAYLVSAVSFSLYHVAGAALANPAYWIFTLQYLPVSLLLCRCYEKCGSIWGSILYHMLVNGIAVKLMSMVA